MSIVVVGCGRSGTNIVLEALRGSPALQATAAPEDKKFFKRGITYPLDYLTKCDTVYFNERQFVDTKRVNPELSVVWTIRDPRDMLMSKLRRGVDTSQGGDCKGTADDGTPEGAIWDLFEMTELYKKLHHKCVVVRMERVLAEPEKELIHLCGRLGISYNESMVDFPSRMRNKNKAKRYGNSIDKSQIAMWKNWRDAYNGWLRRYDMEALFEKVEPLVKYYLYEL